MFLEPDKHERIRRVFNYVPRIHNAILRILKMILDDVEERFAKGINLSLGVGRIEPVYIEPDRVNLDGCSGEITPLSSVIINSYFGTS